MGQPNIEDMKTKKDTIGLIESLKAEDWRLRREVASALGEIGDTKAVEPLIQVLRDSERELGSLDFDFKLQFREVVASALGKIGEPAVKPLVQGLKDGGPGFVVLSGLTDALIKIGSPSVEQLIQCLKDRNDLVRGYASYALGEIGDLRGVRPLIEAMKDEHAGVRKSAARALGEIGDASAVGPLNEAMKDEDEEPVRRTAQEALEKIKAKKS